MKKTIILKQLAVILTISATTFTACNSGGNKASEEQATSKPNTDTVRTAPAETKQKQITEVTHVFSDVDPKLAASIKTIVDHYLHIKNALAGDNDKEAASGGKAMAEAINKVDKSLFTAVQKKVYDDVVDDLKEHASHIGTNAAKIEHQREHFAMMSEDMYDLVKSFGAGRVVYHDHCPMANHNKGAMWLSETREIHNPYFGGKMSECVKVSELIK